MKCHTLHPIRTIIGASPTSTLPPNHVSLPALLQTLRTRRIIPRTRRILPLRIRLALPISKPRRLRHTRIRRRCITGELRRWRSSHRSRRATSESDATATATAIIGGVSSWGGSVCEIFAGGGGVVGAAGGDGGGAGGVGGWVAGGGGAVGGFVGGGAGAGCCCCKGV